MFTRHNLSGMAMDVEELKKKIEFKADVTDLYQVFD